MSKFCIKCNHPVPGLSSIGTAGNQCPHCGETATFSSPRIDSNEDDFSLVEDGMSSAIGAKPKAAAETDSSEIPESIGRFICKKILGKGAFGRVLMAHDPMLDRCVAIKVPKTTSLTEAQIEQIIREARAAARLRHPNVVAVHEVGYENGVVHIVSDYIEGETLSARIRRERPTQEQALNWTIKIARALHHAHSRGLVHRDLKPANIILDEQDEPLVADFGLALMVDPSTDSTSDNLEGSFVGTPAYMSPEQAASMSHEARPTSDVYSLGVILFEMLAGKRPFSGNLSEVRRQTILTPPPKLRSIDTSVPLELDAICLKCLEKEPESRFESALALAEELERFQRGERTLTRPPSLLAYSLRKGKQYRWGIVVGLLIPTMIYLVQWLGFSLYDWNNRRCRILLRINPPTAQIALVPIDEKTGQPLVDQVIRPKVADQYRLTIRPGTYLIEAYAPGVGIQEVYRFAARLESEFTDSQFRARHAQSFESDGRIVWPEITIVSNVDPNRWAKLDGGTFQSGSDIFSVFYPMHEANVAPFEIETAEVTLEEFQAVMGRPPSELSIQQPDAPLAAPAHYVSYWEAIEFAERTGARLPTLDEYLFVATNGGQTKFPWGNELPADYEWPVDATVPSKADQTPTQPPIYSLYSGVLEWTATCPEENANALIPVMLASKALRDDLPSSKRILVGGGPSVRVGRPDPNEFIFGPRGYSQDLINQVPARGVGFRRARSLQPRFVIPNQ